MGPLTRTAAAAWLVCVAATPAAAQQSAPADAEPVVRYRVEFVIFAHRDVDPAEEHFPVADIEPVVPAQPAVRRWPFGIEPEPAPGAFGEPVFGDAAPAAAEPSSTDTSAAAAADATAGGDAAATRQPAADDGPQLELIGPEHFRGVMPERPWFEHLGADAHVLGAARARLDRLDAYEVLAHAAWEQDALPEPDARSLTLAELGIANPSGSLRLHVSRFLHLTVDLGYRTDALQPATRSAADSSGPAGRAAFDPFAPGAALTPLRVPRVYTLQAQRRARSGEIHYIDHPLFGVLFTVTRAPEPEAAPAPAADGLAPAP